MKTKYDELTLTHNLSGVILPTDRYKHIQSKGVYSIPSVIALYENIIYRDATRTEVHQVKGKHETRRNDRALYKTADTACKTFIVEVADKTWYKELEDRIRFIQTSRPSNSLTISPSFIWASIHLKLSISHN